MSFKRSSPLPWYDIFYRSKLTYWIQLQHFLMLHLSLMKSWRLGQHLESQCSHPSAIFSVDPRTSCETLDYLESQLLLMGWRKETIYQTFSPTNYEIRGEISKYAGVNLFCLFQCFLCSIEIYHVYRKQNPKWRYLGTKGMFIIAENLNGHVRFANVTFFHRVIVGPHHLQFRCENWSRFECRYRCFCFTIQEYVFDISECLLDLLTLDISCIRAYLAYCYRHRLGFWCCLCWCSSKREQPISLLVDQLTTCLLF